MTHLSDVPLWAALLASGLLLFGAGLTLLGAVGLFFLRSFYERIHAPTLGTSWGTAGVVLASITVFSTAGEGLLLHELVIGAFITVTTPVTLMLLARASLYRDRASGSSKLPGRVSGAAPTKRGAPGAGERTATKTADDRNGA